MDGGLTREKLEEMRSVAQIWLEATTLDDSMRAQFWMEDNVLTPKVIAALIDMALAK
jgi:hypothetical protein